MKKFALLIIDMQNDFVLPDAPVCVAGAYSTIPTIKKLLDFFREKNLPVFHIYREYRADGSDIENVRLNDFLNNRKYAVPGTKGAEIVDELKPLQGEYRIVKPRFSAFMNTELDFILRRLNITDIVVSGTQYPNCIRTTVFDGISYNYNVTVVTDATSAATKEIAEANIKDMINVGVTCITFKEFLETFPF